MPALDPSPFDQTVTYQCIPLAAIAATTTFAMCTMDRPFRIDRVEVVCDATYAQDAANFYTLTAAHGAAPTTAATWSTQTGAQGTITGGTPGVMVLHATDANRVVPAGATLKFVATKAAAAANITPRIVVRGRFVA